MEQALRQAGLLVSEYRHRENAFAPIHQLPEEVLAHIFTLSVGYENWSLGLIRDLALVCRAWRDVVREAPRLWSVASHGRRSICHLAPSEVALVLRKSKMAPLSIYCDGVECPESLPTFFQALCTHTERWWQLSITNLTSAMIRYLKGVSVPALAYLSITRDSRDPGDGLIEMAVGSLRRLELKHCAIPWDSACWRRLRQLSLSHLEGRTAPSPRELVTILAACPRLRGLFLYRLKLGPKESEAHRADDDLNIPIQLPLLRKLRLLNIHLSLLKPLIGSLSAPGVEHLSVASDHALATLQLLSRPDSALKSAIESILHRKAPDEVFLVRLADSPDQDCVSLSIREQSRPSLALYGPNPVECLRSLVGSMPFRNIHVPIDLHIEGEDLASQWTSQSAAFLREIPSLSSIHLSNPFLASHVLAYLSHPQSSSETPQISWPAPRLKTIAFDLQCVGDGVSLLGFLQRRYGEVEQGSTNTEGSDSPPLERPILLEKIVLPRIDLTPLLTKLMEETLCRPVHCHTVPSDPRSRQLVLMEKDVCALCLGPGPMIDLTN